MIEARTRAEERLPEWRWDRYDAAFVGAAMIATCLVHPISRMLKHPYWLDEAWVADLTRAPLSRVVGLSSSTPVGFVALLRMVPGAGLQRGRLVVLAFSVLTMVAAYAVTRLLPWASRGTARLAAIVAALVVMLVPVSLLRNDLKQYTCDAFCALVVLAVGAWADRSARPSRLWWLAATAVIVVPFSSTSAFVSVAMFSGLLASALIGRSWRRARHVLVAAVVMAIGVIAYFGAAVVPNLNDRLRDYWNSQYLSGTPQHMLHVSWGRLARLGGALAMPAFVFVAFFAIGIVVLVRMRAHALAAAVVFLWFEMAVVAWMRRYPFLDLRTSTFLLVSSFVIVAIGAVGLVLAVARLRVTSRAFVSTGLAAVLGGLLAALFAVGFVPHVHELSIPDENVRSQTLAVAALRQPRDVIVVNDPGNFGFSYYWPRGHVAFSAGSNAQGFRTEAIGVDAIYAHGRGYPKVLAALEAGLDRRQHAGAGSRLFIVRTHLTEAERAAWGLAFRELHLKPAGVRFGSSSLLVVGPARRAGG